MQSMTTNPVATQSELVLRARDGDREAYDRLFALAAERVKIFIRLRLGAQLKASEQSVDVLQDAYLVAHRRFEAFEWQGDDAFVRWLCGIADLRIRQLREHHGAEKRQVRGTVPAVTEVLERVSASGCGPLTAAGRVEGRERLERAISRLDADVRDALLFRFFEGLEISAIADRLGRSATSVRRLLGRGIRSLGSELREKGDR